MDTKLSRRKERFLRLRSRHNRYLYVVLFA